MSWAGGWFFLMAAEVYTVGGRDFRLPGLGAYLHQAAQAGDTGALLMGVGTLVVLIFLLDQLVWRPLLAWGERFQLEMVETQEPTASWFYSLLQRSRLLDRFQERVARPASEWVDRRLGGRPAEETPERNGRGMGQIAGYAVGALITAGLLYGAVRAALLLAGLPPAVELGTAPGEPGTTRALPLASVSALAGLLEHLDEAPGNRVDLYQVADDLRMEIDDLLPVVEAGEILDLLRVQQGDGCLTPLGETFAEASILARKEIFASRLRRVPLIRWILKGLHSAPGQRVGRQFFQDVLEWEFRPEEAGQQMDQAINWGRYGELFGYDDDADQLYLEAERNSD